MKKYSIGMIVVLALVFVSCQKEIDWGTNAVTSQQLKMIRSMTGSDSTVITYSYDAQGRLVGETTVGVSGAQTLDMTFVVKRNASGIITTTIQKSPALLAAGIDSLLTRYDYNSTTSRYLCSVFTISFGIFTVKDSAVYTYDGSGRIVSDLHWLVSGIIPAFEGLKNQYTYSPNGLNLSKADQLAAANPGDPLSIVATQTYTFDAKTGPLILKNEAILLGRLGFYNANNASKLDLVSVADPTQNFSMAYTYKYNTAGKPDSSYGTRTPGGTVTASKYFYQ